MDTAVQQLQSAVDALREVFESQLKGNGSCDATVNLQEIQCSDDPELLEDVAEDLLETSLSYCCEIFWQHIDGASSQRWEAGLNSFQKLLREHERLLHHLALGEASKARLISAQRVAFRVAFTSTWPLQVADNLQVYFQQTWNQCFRHQGETLATEWWCVGLENPVQRVLALLEPWENQAQRTSSSVSSVRLTAASTDEDVVMGADDADGDEEDEDELDIDEENADNNLPGLRVVSKAMHSLGLQAPWVDLAKRFFTSKVAQLLEERCRSEYDKKGLLDRLTRLFYGSMLRWLRAVFGLPLWAPSTLKEDAGQTSEDVQAEESWWHVARGAVLRFFEAFLEVRLGEAFDMVRDFPESAPALLDLRRCLARTGRSSPLVVALREQIGDRLLIAGAHTRDVIEVYIKTIKALRLVDPRGLLLEGVSTPIREYLKKRKDTVRCIITALTEDSDLQQELQLGAEALATASKKAKLQAGQPALPHEPPDLAGEDFEASDDEEDPDAWVPDPIDADPQPLRPRKADVVSLLVGIYGSKEMFIKEYKEMLADRLLGNPTYNTERETQNLELLKTRFGDAALTHCEVMLQDIKDSKRINSNVQQKEKDSQQSDGVGLGQMHPLVLSQHYWPSALSKVDHPRFRLPAPLENALADYSAAYGKTKANRAVQWKRAHGLVEITVQFADRSLNVTVTPVHYAVLACFSEAKGSPTRLSLEELMTQLELPDALVRKRVAFWVAKGVLKEVTANVYELQESAPAEDRIIQSGHMDEDTENSPGQPTAGPRRSAQREAELRACEPFIQGMLKNYAELPLPRIHNFLQRFMMEPAYTLSEKQLRDFLAQLVEEGKLDFDGSGYTLVQNGPD